jgi:hypothetical protein
MRLTHLEAELARKGKTMGSRNAKKTEQTVKNSYAPLNIVAVSHDDDRVILLGPGF